MQKKKTFITASSTRIISTAGRQKVIKLVVYWWQVMHKIIWKLHKKKKKTNLIKYIKLPIPSFMQSVNFAQLYHDVDFVSFRNRLDVG